MQSEKKSPLLIFGTPFGPWHPLARSILKGACRTEEDSYASWHRELFGIGATELEVGLSRLRQPKLELPVDLTGKIAKLARNGAANSEWAGASVFGCWTAEDWLKPLPSATCLVFYEHPARMISRCLAADPTGSPEALLSIWSASAQKIVSAVRRYRTRLLLLNVQECLSFGKKYLLWVQKHLGITPDTDGSARESGKEDAVLLVLAEVLCSENSLITNLVRELDASAQPLADEWDSSGSVELAKIADTAINELLATRRKSGEFTARDREKEDTISKLEDEIEKHKERALKKEKDFAAREREIEEDKILAQRKEREAVSTHETLLAELHEAFKESEHYFEMWKKAEVSGEKLSLRVDSVIRLDAKEKSEHRHINYTFRGVNLFDRHWPAIHLRLVQHLGHAGLAIFSEDSLKPPLYQWVPSDRENGTPFMLFVLADAPAREALVRATTSDLVFIGDAISLIHSDLDLNGLPGNGHTNWIQVAERLQQEIQEIPERLHYDSVRAELKSPAGHESPFLFDVTNASFRGRVFPSLKIAWGPSIDGRRFSVRLADRAHPPLSYWPRAADERLLDEINIRGCWNQFTGKDKALLRTIILEVPNFLVHAANQHPASGIDWKRLRLGARISNVMRPLVWRNFRS
jgi:hypothetical protein